MIKRLKARLMEEEIKWSNVAEKTPDTYEELLNFRLGQVAGLKRAIEIIEELEK